jgi:hypothetical protein
MLLKAGPCCIHCLRGSYHLFPHQNTKLAAPMFPVVNRAHTLWDYKRKIRNSEDWIFQLQARRALQLNVLKSKL